MSSIWKSKDYKSALCIIPPNDLWDLPNNSIQCIRKKHDKGYVRWMPHINYCFPFCPNNEFNIASEKLEHLLQNFKPFKISLKNFEYFKHKKSSTLWLKPVEINNNNNNNNNNSDDEKNDSLQELFKLIQTEFSYFEDGRNIRGFIPHMSVGQFKTHEIDEYKNKFEKNWSPIEFEVTHLHLISRKDFDDPFSIQLSIKLGGGK